MIASAAVGCKRRLGFGGRFDEILAEIICLWFCSGKPSDNSSVNNAPQSVELVADLVQLADYDGPARSRLEKLGSARKVVMRQAVPAYTSSFQPIAES